MFLLALACRDAPDESPGTGTDSDTDAVDTDTQDTVDPHEGWTWSWENPHPHGNAIEALWGAEGRLWAVGENGIAMDWDGSTWNTGTLPLSEDFQDGHYDLWGWSAENLAVGTAPGVVMWNPATTRAHTVSTSPAFARVLWGFDDHDIWAVGGGVVTRTWRYEGSYWEQAEFPTMSRPTAMFGTSRDRVVAVGWTGEIASFDGTSWTLVINGTENLHAVWSAGPKHPFWVAGEGGTIFSFDDEPTAYDAGTHRDLYAVAGTRQDDVWAVGERGMSLHWDGAGWQQRDTGVERDLKAIWAAAEDDVWAAGDDGVLVHWGGLGWTPWSEGEYGDLTSLAADPDSALWAAGEDVLARNGDDWVDAEIEGGVVTAAGSDVYVLSNDSYARRTDNGWEVTAAPWDDVVAAEDGWAVGSGIYAFDSGTWALSDATGGHRAVSVAGTAVFAAGEQVRTFDGVSWSELPFPWDEDAPVVGLYSPDGVVLWAGGERGLYRWDGSAWDRVSDDKEAPQYDVADIGGRGGDDVYVLLRTGPVYHWDGVHWRVVRDMTSTGQRVLWVGEQQVVTAGDDGAILAFQP